MVDASTANRRRLEVGALKQLRQRGIERRLQVGRLVQDHDDSRRQLSLRDGKAERNAPPSDSSEQLPHSRLRHGRIGRNVRKGEVDDRLQQFRLVERLVAGRLFPVSLVLLRPVPAEVNNRISRHQRLRRFLFRGGQRKGDSRRDSGDEHQDDGKNEIATTHTTPVREGGRRPGLSAQGRTLERSQANSTRRRKQDARTRRSRNDCQAFGLGREVPQLMSRSNGAARPGGGEDADPIDHPEQSIAAV